MYTLKSESASMLNNFGMLKFCAEVHKKVDEEGRLLEC
jgi:hypothetical protein